MITASEARCKTLNSKKVLDEMRIVEEKLEKFLDEEKGKFEFQLNFMVTNATKVNLENLGYIVDVYSGYGPREPGMTRIVWSPSKDR